MKHFLILLVVLGALVLTACSVAAPKRFDAESSAIGITVESVPPSGAIFSRPLSSVTFIRLEGDGDYDYAASFRPIPSNFVRGDQIYLLNAKPGRYAVVLGRQFGQRGAQYTSYFPEEMLKISEVDVLPNRFVFMGEYTIDASTDLDNLDPMQSHFIGLFEPGQQSIPTFLQGMRGKISYKGTILEGL